MLGAIAPNGRNYYFNTAFLVPPICIKTVKVEMFGEDKYTLSFGERSSKSLFKPWARPFGSDADLSSVAAAC